MSQAMATLSLKLPVEVKNRLDRLAENTDTSRSKLAADAIASFVDLYEWQVAEIHRGLAEADDGDFASPEEVRTVFEKWGACSGSRSRDTGPSITAARRPLGQDHHLRPCYE